MKPEFLENYRNEHEDTLDARTYDFDWAELERRLGEADEQIEDRDFAALGSAPQSIIEWIIEGADFTKLDADAHVGRRAIALFWTLNPDYFEGVSLTALANRLGLHKAILSAPAAEAAGSSGLRTEGRPTAGISARQNRNHRRPARAEHWPRPPCHNSRPGSSSPAKRRRSTGDNSACRSRFLIDKAEYSRILPCRT